MRDYEDGMAVDFDAVSKSVFIEFRNQLHYIIGPYTTRRDAIAAGEAKCRELGWRPTSAMVKSACAGT